MKKLKLYNGHCGRIKDNDCVYIAAYSRADAARMMVRLFDPSCHKESVKPLEGRWQREIKEYFGQCWGNTMNGIKPKHGIWLTKKYNDKPVFVYDGEKEEIVEYG